MKEMKEIELKKVNGGFFFKRAYIPKPLRDAITSKKGAENLKKYGSVYGNEA